MKNIEIITIISQNYGNRLQNYALQENLKKMGFNVVTDRFTTRSAIEKIMVQAFKIRAKKRHDLFNRFENMISWGDESYLNRYNPSIDFYVAGSDQIWNPNFEFNSDREFLSFAPPEKRIAYAASIGVDEIPDDLKDKYATFFREFKSLSVREEQAGKIIYELTGRSVPVLVDPVFLLEKSEWDKVIKKSRVKPKRPYVLKYFLGEQKQENNCKIKAIAEKNGLDIIDISPNSLNSNAGPSEFVSLINGAEWVVTDSFHATAFCVIFEKSFLSVERSENAEDAGQTMYSRFETLNSKFDIGDCLIRSGETFPEDIIRTDFASARENLTVERERAERFLREALN